MIPFLSIVIGVGVIVGLLWHVFQACLFGICQRDRCEWDDDSDWWFQDDMRER